jgi:hypothetical protein
MTAIIDKATWQKKVDALREDPEAARLEAAIDRAVDEFLSYFRQRGVIVTVQINKTSDSLPGDPLQAKAH